jgi:hypothetical protein
MLPYIKWLAVERMNNLNIMDKFFIEKLIEAEGLDSCRISVPAT